MLLGAVLSGCATNKVNWASRVGSYSLDQAVIDYGPPDKQAKLSDGSLVAEWLTQRSRTYVHSMPMTYPGFYPWSYGYHSPFVDTYTTPDYILRLVFGNDGLLRDFRRGSR